VSWPSGCRSAGRQGPSTFASSRMAASSCPEQNTHAGSTGSTPMEWPPCEPTWTASAARHPPPINRPLAQPHPSQRSTTARPGPGPVACRTSPVVAATPGAPTSSHRLVGRGRRVRRQGGCPAPSQAARNPLSPFARSLLARQASTMPRPCNKQQLEMSCWLVVGLCWMAPFGCAARHSAWRNGDRILTCWPSQGPR
jgi:hypothetical protein